MLKEKNCLTSFKSDAHAKRHDLLIHGKTGKYYSILIFQNNNSLYLEKGSKAGKVFVCLVCQEAFKSQYYLNKHRKDYEHTKNKAAPGKKIGQPKK